MALRTVYEMACFFVSFEGYVPVNMQFKFQQSVQMTVIVPRFQFIDRVGHCRHATVTGFPLVQTVQKTVVIRPCSSLARLFTSRCCAPTGAMVRQCCSVEVPPRTTKNHQEPPRTSKNLQQPTTTNQPTNQPPTTNHQPTTHQPTNQPNKQTNNTTTHTTATHQQQQHNINTTTQHHQQHTTTQQHNNTTHNTQQHNNAQQRTTTHNNAQLQRTTRTHNSNTQNTPHTHFPHATLDAVQTYHVFLWFNSLYRARAPHSHFLQITHNH